jgi:ABC-type phosphate/phosphonate transport system permease subunit
VNGLFSLLYFRRLLYLFSYFFSFFEWLRLISLPVSDGSESYKFRVDDRFPHNIYLTMLRRNSLTAIAITLLAIIFSLTTTVSAASKSLKPVFPTLFVLVKKYPRSVRKQLTRILGNSANIFLQMHVFQKVIHNRS